MLTPAVNKALNEQMNAEFYSAWLYLSMATWCMEQNWDGFAHWLGLQSKEEKGHGLKILRYIDDRQGKIQLGEIAAPINDWVSLQTVFEAALVHEQETTKNIDLLAELATTEHDRGTVVFLDWFVLEQIEEEKQTDDILRHLVAFAGKQGPTLLLDTELAKRAD